MIHNLAQELNNILADSTIGVMLSDLGSRMYFPKGIIAQSVEAKNHGKKANATIGVTLKNGTPLILPAIQEQAPGLTAQELVAYSPTAGNLTLRELWKEKIKNKNPALINKNFSLPVVVPGLTAGLSYLSDLFLSAEDVLLTADPSWDNYSLIVTTRRNANIQPFNLFANNAFDRTAFKTAMHNEGKKGIVKLLLNFPQNPSGFSPSINEAKQICQIIKETAENGAQIMVWCDDAYFGLNHEDYIEKQSLFSYLCDIHKNIVAVKIDGPTKEDFAWGLRCGFLTFGGKGLTHEHYDAIIKKLMGCIRSSVSCAATPSQTMILNALNTPAIEEQKNAYKEVLTSRYTCVRAFLDTKKDDQNLTPLPFNSGYFMSFHTNTINAEKLRQKLLTDYQIGTIAIDEQTLRVAFSSIDEEQIQTVYASIYEAASRIANA
ncbi:MAG TPA: aminotransferase class I/II-fold pyridoxal phosphate-dependent enzyme [Treponemataceae bacterium]|nr:aminotransferase class I/II-fold pyridoxal phosphate-dependent enzyme [Treponemataceae bacterium]